MLRAVVDLGQRTTAGRVQRTLGTDEPVLTFSARVTVTSTSRRRHGKDSDATADGTCSDGRNASILAGLIGTGKTHLAIELGLEAARQRRRVAFWRAADLVRTLVEAGDAKELGRYQRRLDRVDVLIIHEVDFVPFDASVVSCSSTPSAPVTSTAPVVITTNLALGEWPKVFGGDERLTTALLDRLAESATIITTHARASAPRSAPPTRCRRPRLAITPM